MNDGGPAFPCEGGPDSGLHPDPGMSLRDYTIVHLTAAWVVTLGVRYQEHGYADHLMSHEAAMRATEQADALLAERAKEKTKGADHKAGA